MEQDRSTIAVQVPAATLILARQKAEELQIYLLNRNPRSRFMAGNYVFPGGMVEPQDRDKAWGGACRFGPRKHFSAVWWQSDGRGGPGLRGGGHTNLTS